MSDDEGTVASAATRTAAVIGSKDFLETLPSELRHDVLKPIILDDEENFGCNGVYMDFYTAEELASVSRIFLSDIRAITQGILRDSIMSDQTPHLCLEDPLNFGEQCNYHDKYDRDEDYQDHLNSFIERLAPFDTNPKEWPSYEELKKECAVEKVQQKCDQKIENLKLKLAESAVTINAIQNTPSFLNGAIVSREMTLYDSQGVRGLVKNFALSYLLMLPTVNIHNTAYPRTVRTFCKLVFTSLVWGLRP